MGKNWACQIIEDHVIAGWDGVKLNLLSETWKLNISTMKERRKAIESQLLMESNVVDDFCQTSLINVQHIQQTLAKFCQIF